MCGGATVNGRWTGVVDSMDLLAFIAVLSESVRRLGTVL